MKNKNISNKKYYEKNREKIKAINNIYRLKNIEYYRDYMRKYMQIWRKNNPEKVRGYVSKYYHKLKIFKSHRLTKPMSITTRIKKAINYLGYIKKREKRKKFNALPYSEKVLFISQNIENKIRSGKYAGTL